jgi:hypothetical protein
MGPGMQTNQFYNAVNLVKTSPPQPTLREYVRAKKTKGQNKKGGRVGIEKS